MSRQTKRRLLLGGAAVVVVLAVVAAVLIPSIQSSKHKATALEQREAQATTARERRRIALDQRLHTAAAPGSHAALGGLPATRLAAVLRGDLQASITADARARVKQGTLQGPILRTDCSALPGFAGPPVGKYTCTAVNSNILRGGGATAGALGYPFWAIVDFRTLSYRWCKINPAAGEGSATPGTVSLVVPLPKGCDVDL